MKKRKAFTIEGAIAGSRAARARIAGSRVTLTGRRKRRSGTIYLLVMSLAMLVGAIGLGALVAARAQVRNGNAAADFAVARLCARSGLDLATFYISSDPSWRTTRGNGTWCTGTLANGNFTVSAADPITGDITVASNHPVILTATGTKGAAVYSLQTTVQVSTPPLSCLGVSMCASAQIQVAASTTLTTNQTLASNDTFKNSGVINGNIEYAGSAPSGSGTASGSSQAMTSPLSLPSSTNVTSYYTTNGSAIPYTALFQSGNTELVSNPSFETNTTGWYVYAPNALNTAVISKSSAKHQDGGSSLLITGRSSTGDVPAIDLPLANIRSGDAYAVSLPVYASGLGNVAATLTLQATGGVSSFSTANTSIPLAGGWVTLTGSLTPTWSGTLTKATLTLTTSNLLNDLYIDKVSVKDATLPATAYLMDRIVLSPASNPYGATNAQGIYVLDCNNQNVTIGPCRIVGTLVLLNAGPNTLIQGPITWEPAVTGYPALLTDKKITISFDKSVGLSESTYGVNFNPPGTPYPYIGGNTNTTTTDGFPSAINGIIYSGADLAFSSNAAINGCVIAAGNVNVTATALTLVYGSASFLNPPPGFPAAVQTVTPQPGSWQRVTQ